MKRALFILVCMMAVSACMAQNVKLRHDTLRIYATWQVLMNDNPHLLVENPLITQYEQTNRLDLSTAGGSSKNYINATIKQAMAVAISNDNANEYFVNCAWLNQNVKDGAGELGRNGFLPMFFNDKMACVVLSDFFYPTRWKRDAVVYTKLYHLDFEHGRVKEITPKYLIDLLGRYPDLRLRYEGNRHQNDAGIMIDFLEKYMNRIASDETVPYIDELLTKNE